MLEASKLYSTKMIIQIVYAVRYAVIPSGVLTPWSFIHPTITNQNMDAACNTKQRMIYCTLSCCNNMSSLFCYEQRY